MNRTDRLYAIAEQLRAAGTQGRSSAWLARHFEVSTRTVKRDVAALQQAGLPVWAAEGRNGGYRVREAASLPPLSFTAGEAAALAIALAAEPTIPFAPDGASALAKIMGAMDAEQRSATAQLAARVWMRLPTRAARPRAARALDEALRASVVVTIDYRDGDGRLTRRRAIEPLAFARTGGHWYALAYCRRRRAGRWFRLDRVTGAWPTRERFAPRDLTELFGLPPDDAQPVRLDLPWGGPAADGD